MTTFFVRARRHLHKVRRRGLVRVAKEDVSRARTALRKYRWRLANDVRPNALPVFVVGLQRSGTNMLVDGLNQSPEIEVYNETSPKAFHEFQLRNDGVVRRLVERSRHRRVVFKSLCDSHRVVDLIEELGTPRKGRAIWIYRSWEGRVRSVLALFPENNRRVLREIAEGRDDERWEAGGLSTESLELIRSVDYDEITRESAGALMWYVRNALYFDLGLDERRDVALVSYDELLADPHGVMCGVCEFLDIAYDPRMAAHISRRPPATTIALDVDPRIQAKCVDLERRLDAARGIGVAFRAA